MLRALRQYLKFWARQGLNDFTFADYKGLLFEQNKYNLELSNKFGKVYGGFLFLDKYLAINDPEIIREVFVKSFSVVPDHKHIHLGPSPKVSNIVFFIPGDDNWKRIRSIITPAFSSGKLKAMMSSISDISDKFVKSLEPFEKSGNVSCSNANLIYFELDN